MRFRRYLSTGVNDVFKNTMARVANQAMILTAGFPHQNQPPATHSLHGMTLGSVCSLSVYPKPLLQFNLHLPSYTSQSLHDNGGVLAIHLLSPTAQSSKLARIFASGIKQNRHFVSDGADGEVFHEMTTPFSKIDRSEWTTYTYKNTTIPILAHSDRTFVCEKERVFEVDNHEIWVVRVVDILGDSSDKSGGLVYFNRSFHTVGRIIDE